MLQLSDRAFLTIVVTMWGFKAKGGRLENLLDVAREYFGTAIYERIWAALVDIWEAIGDDNRLNAPLAEHAAKSAGFNLCNVQAWQKMKQGGKR